MSTCISIFFDKNISQQEFFALVKSIGGIRQNIEKCQQGVLTDNGATIWLYFRGDKFNLDHEEKTELTSLMKDAKTEIFIELGSHKNSNNLAKSFCIEASNQYGGFIIYSSEGDFLPMEHINKALYIE